MSVKNYNDLCVKIFLMGDKDVGKCCLLNSYSSASPLSFNNSTFTWPNYTITTTHNEKPLKLRLVIGDDNELKRIKQIEFNDIFLICFAIDDPISFTNVLKWNIEIKKILPTPNIILVGTKSDTRNEQGGATNLISIEQGIEKAKEINATKYLECSSATYDGVKSIFDEGINIYFSKKLYGADLRKKSFLIPKKNSTSNKRSSCKTQ
ncbi:hypothetical protein DICPUDRAFT_147341 [Dictyostelium purpureum]|uniref:Rho GTPase n=1 Tax=Dictyostelium purpureum TaxID=5786 RepID=F0Z895_DICPU|nr:uncharacterized protein DICPUDRAFT_147341 [Dictyostelium purpureum]EGC39892.1 hypothetical protein DICPUDRAFT_147341 [Dictyostelium purpureum]|eukprot:XP_003283643.1 hypothetical protein DICPUDRAFT_147341 [Dictyostelium purpureum]